MSFERASARSAAALISAALNGRASRRGLYFAGGHRSFGSLFGMSLCGLPTLIRPWMHCGAALAALRNDPRPTLSSPATSALTSALEVDLAKLGDNVRRAAPRTARSPVSKIYRKIYDMGLKISTNFRTDGAQLVTLHRRRDRRLGSLIFLVSLTPTRRTVRVTFICIWPKLTKKSNEPRHQKTEMRAAEAKLRAM